MGKLLILASCCFVIAASDSDTNSFLAFHGEPEPGHVEAVKDRHMQELFGQLLGKRSLHVGPGIGPFPLLSGPSPPIGIPPVPEVMMLHNQLQNKLGWGSGDDDGMRNSNNNQQYGPPPGPPPNQQYGPPPNQQYGPPPSQQYGPPPGPPPNQQYGPPQGPPPNQQYGPPPGPPPNQQYGPPQGPPPNQQYGPPPNQQYGPPPGPPPNQQYGPPPGPPPSQQYGPPPPPPNQQYGPPKQQYEPPPPPPNQQYGPPQQNQPSQEYGPPQQSQPNQEYGPPQQSQPNQEYGPPQQSQPNQEYGPPGNDNKLRVNQGTFGGHIENFKLADVVRNNKDRSPTKSAPSSQYGPPSFTDDSGYSNNGLDDGSSTNAKIYKHVYIHTPPHEQEEELEPRVIRPSKKQDTHYQIIFVKAPAPPKQQATEIELPAPPERKTLVYVLVKKPEKPGEIKFRAPPPTQPAKPEVYFIRYKGNKGQNGDRAEDLLSQIGAKDVITTNSRPLRLNNVDDDDGGYDSKRGGDSAAKLRPSLTTKDRDSVGYPNAEYRAPPIMLNPNEESMSFAVYDRVRNEKVPSSPIVGGLSTSASDLDLIVRRSSRKLQIKKGGSHYTAPGSLPFDRPSGRMVSGHYVGMTSTALRNKYYSPLEEVK